MTNKMIYLEEEMLTKDPLIFRCLECLMEISVLNALTCRCDFYNECVCKNEVPRVPFILVFGHKNKVS